MEGAAHLDIQQLNGFCHSRAGRQAGREGWTLPVCVGVSVSMFGLLSDGH